MYHLISRCCESAGIWKNEISVVNKSSQLLTNSIIQFDLTLKKTMKQPVVYPHKFFLWDVYFSLGMHLAVEYDPDGVLFPYFLKKIKK